MCNIFQYLDEQQLARKEELIKRTHNPCNETYAIEAVPLSCLLPDAPTVVFSAMQNSKVYIWLLVRRCFVV